MAENEKQRRKIVQTRLVKADPYMVMSPSTNQAEEEVEKYPTKYFRCECGCWFFSKYDFIRHRAKCRRRRNISGIALELEGMSNGKT